LHCAAFVTLGETAVLSHGDDQLSEVARRLSELLAIVEHRTAETDVGSALRPTERVGCRWECLRHNGFLR
jgi:hypothetical protein